MSYARQGKAEARRCDFWATLHDSGTRTVRHSPAFDAQSQLVGWIAAHRRPADEVVIMRRDITAGGFKDCVLSTDDEHEPVPDLARLHAMLSPLRDKLRVDAKERKMPMRTGARPVPETRHKKLDLVARAQERSKQAARYEVDMLSFDEVYPAESQATSDRTTS